MDYVDMESMQRKNKRLSGELIDTKKSFGEGTSNKKPYTPLFRRSLPPRAIELPPTNLNIYLE